MRNLKRDICILTQCPIIFIPSMYILAKVIALKAPTKIRVYKRRYANIIHSLFVNLTTRCFCKSTKQAVWHSIPCLIRNAKRTIWVFYESATSVNMCTCGDDPGFCFTTVKPVYLF